ncbi:MAG: cobaltochelatase subunit CobN, partial [Candidatus Methanomethylophilaceae archaeon]|nr:cobaltochelatase subunit CobN [Candidatus Methanomethylophilaceae archaeon]
MVSRAKFVYVCDGLSADKMNEICGKYSADTGIRTEVLLFRQKTIDDDPLEYARFIKECSDADAVLVRHLFAPQKFRRLQRIADRLKDKTVLIHCPNADLSAAYRKLFPGSDADWNLMYLLLSDISCTDETEVIKLLANIIGLASEDIRIPEKAASTGLYVKGEGLRGKEYIIIDRSRPAAGILIRTYMFRTMGTDCADMLIETLEKYGVQTVPVVFPGASVITGGPEGARSVFYDYFTDNGTPIVDAVICISPFSLLVSAGESLRDEDNFLRSLTGVPVFQTMLAQGDFLDFADMRAGADRRTISSFTAWAELDGQIDCVPIGCMTRDAGGNALTIPLPERIDHLSRLVRNWINLRRKENKDKRIAVVLYQKLADCGRIGSAAGLDCA